MYQIMPYMYMLGLCYRSECIYVTDNVSYMFGLCLRSGDINVTDNALHVHAIGPSACM